MSGPDGAGRRHEVVIVGPFPPPVHGMSAITGFIADSLGTRARVTKADISAFTLAPGTIQQTLKALRVVWALGRIAVRRLASARRLYIPSSNGPGIFYTVALAGLGRALGYQTFLHHHSFAYIDRSVWRMALLARVAGPHAVHVFLCACMKRRFFERYPAAKTAVVVSNATYVEPAAAARCSPRGALRLGHMSNLCEDKGLTKVLDITRRLVGEGRNVRLVLAGPFVTEEDKQQVDRAMSELGDIVDYRGPVYGADKTRFLSEIDVFLFPSSYVHEAQPVVVFEAMACGVPTISYARSCIEEALAGGGGIALPVKDDFVASACRVLGDWMADEDLLTGVREKALETAARHKQAADSQFRAFLDLLSGNDVGADQAETKPDTRDAAETLS